MNKKMQKKTPARPPSPLRPESDDSPTIDYTLCPVAPDAHLFEVHCRIGRPAPAGQRVALPAWIPGSYLVRDFARHIVALRAETDAGRPLEITKIDKSTWQLPPLDAPVTLIYRVYAGELSVRAAYLDRHYALGNGTSLFLRVEGAEDRPCRLDIQPPPGEPDAGWKVATALPSDGAPPWGFGPYRAGNYAELIDQPLLLGHFERLDFKVEGQAHHFVLAGGGTLDGERLRQDLAAICARQMACFGPPALAEPYCFLTLASGSGYGGLEHRNAAALLVARADLPPPGLGDAPPPENYVRLLGLCSHEYWHRWLVKRIRPAAFVAPDLGRENYTRLLWLFEGFTAYYDELWLVRAGVITEACYLERLGKTMSQVAQTPGRHRQSLAEASFDAWIKYYRPDENSANASISYYSKGALVALCLDLALRRQSAGRQNLDDLMRHLWRQYGQHERALGETEIFAIVAELGGKALARWLRQSVEGTDDLPLAQALAWVGVRLDWQADGDTPWIGAQWAEKPGNSGDGSGEIRLTQVRNDAPAEQAGLAAGDLLVALDGERLSRANFAAMLARARPGVPRRCHYFRHERLMQTELVPAEAPRETARLTLRPGQAAAARRAAWLSGD